MKMGRMFFCSSVSVGAGVVGEIGPSAHGGENLTPRSSLLSVPLRADENISDMTRNEQKNGYESQRH